MINISEFLCFDLSLSLVLKMMSGVTTTPPALGSMTVDRQLNILREAVEGGGGGGGGSSVVNKSAVTKVLRELSSGGGGGGIAVPPSLPLASVLVLCVCRLPSDSQRQMALVALDKQVEGRGMEGELLSLLVPHLYAVRLSSNSSHCGAGENALPVEPVEEVRLQLWQSMTSFLQRVEHSPTSANAGAGAAAFPCNIYTPLFADMLAAGLADPFPDVKRVMNLLFIKEEALGILIFNLFSHIIYIRIPRLFAHSSPLLYWLPSCLPLHLLLLHGTRPWLLLSTVLLTDIL